TSRAPPRRRSCDRTRRAASGCRSELRSPAARCALLRGLRARVTIVALWKPYGYVSRFTDEGAHPGLASLVTLEGVYPIGRLDRDSEGLLLLGDDGALAHALTDPRGAHPRTYWAQVERVPDPSALAALARGVVVQGRRTRPAKARLLPRE